MAKYGNFNYGTAKYGATPKLRYSVEPMSITVVNFDDVKLGWQSPKGDFTRLRVVRNQIGFPEHAEDGVIIWDEFSNEGTVQRSGADAFHDGKTNPNDLKLATGQYAYYRVFLFTTEQKWVVAGSIYDLIPSNHDSHLNMYKLLPQMYTTKEQIPFGTLHVPEYDDNGNLIDPGSVLYQFFYGLSFTYEQLLTYADLLLPSLTQDSLPPSLLPIASINKGILPESNLPIKNQKRLIREASNHYRYKGLKLGIENYTESLTGYAPSATFSPNLMLTVQDSSFYKTTGNWVAESGVTLTASTSNGPTTSETNAIDTTWNCHAQMGTQKKMTLGVINPITRGVPVNENSEYTFSLMAKILNASKQFSVKLSYYSQKGTLISDSSSTFTCTTSWAAYSKTVTTPAKTKYVGITITNLSSSTETFIFDALCLQEGASRKYYEARAIDIFLSPDKTNWINNPSFESNVTDGWSVEGTAVTITQDNEHLPTIPSGTKSAKVVSTDDWLIESNDIPVSYGTYYTFSMYVKSAESVTISFIGKDADGIPTGHVEQTTYDQVSDWSRVEKFDLVDAIGEANVAFYSIAISGGAGTFYLDCAQFELGSRATDYFDGNLTSTHGVVWDGAENNSYSHTYYSKDVKVPRLASNIDEYLPPNAFWTITTFEKVEYTNLTV